MKRHITLKLKKRICCVIFYYGVFELTLNRDIAQLFKFSNRTISSRVFVKIVNVHRTCRRIVVTIFTAEPR